MAEQDQLSWHDYARYAEEYFAEVWALIRWRWRAAGLAAVSAIVISAAVGVIRHGWTYLICDDFLNPVYVGCATGILALVVALVVAPARIQQRASAKSEELDKALTAAKGTLTACLAGLQSFVHEIEGLDPHNASTFGPGWGACKAKGFDGALERSCDRDAAMRFQGLVRSAEASAIPSGVGQGIVRDTTLVWPVIVKAMREYLDKRMDAAAR